MAWIKTIEFIERAKRVARCRNCSKFIIKDEPRCRKYGTFTKYIYSYYFCYKCGQKVLNAEIKMLNKAIKELKKFKVDLRKLTNKSKEILIISLLQNENK